MKKVLFISNIGGERVSNFSISSLLAAKELGFEFHIAANWDNSTPQQMKSEEKKYGIKLHHIDFVRNPFHPGNYKAYKQLLALMKKEEFYIVHCNTPVGGVIGRICAKRARVNHVIYMAHGFHFYKGAPKKNWFLYYPAERALALITNVLITINKEDYNKAQKFKLRKKGQVHYVPGVGIDSTKFKIENIDKKKKRNEFGIPSDAFVVLSVGELNNNKNHETILKAIAKIKSENVYYVICGIGTLEEYLKDLVVSLGISDRVKFLGYRSDIPVILKIADIFAFPSKREGLGLAALEAMASGLPIITSNVHGIVDYSINGVTGFSYRPDDVDGFVAAIITLENNENLLNKMGINNIEAVKRYDVNNAKNAIKEIYEQI